MGATITLETLYQPIEAPLESVRETVGQLWLDALELVNLENAPKPKVSGKLLRPALCLLSAGAIGARDLQFYVRLASAFEALHIASLAHDDVIDKALLRRGASSLNALWDNHAAVLGGDYLVARAVEFLCEYDHCLVVANAIKSVRCMAEGELQFFGRDERTITEADCILLAEQKTASLFAEACSAPSHVIDSAYRDTLHRFGMALGTAFQIVDDLLDLTQTSDGLGKPACGDVAAGKMTLPIRHMRAAMDAAERKRFAALRGAQITDADRDWLGELLERSGARDRAEATARDYTAKALSRLGELPGSEFRESMESIVELLLIRVA